MDILWTEQLANRRICQLTNALSLHSTVTVAATALIHSPLWSFWSFTHRLIFELALWIPSRPNEVKQSVTMIIIILWPLRRRCHQPMADFIDICYWEASKSDQVNCALKNGPCEFTWFLANHNGRWSQMLLFDDTIIGCQLDCDRCLIRNTDWLSV